jgi:hypothetical protein
LPGKEQCRRHDDKQEQSAVSEEGGCRPAETGCQNEENAGCDGHFEKRGREIQVSVAGGKRKAQIAHTGEGTERLPQPGQDEGYSSPCDKDIECSNDQKPQTQDQGYEKIRHFGAHVGRWKTQVNCKIHGIASVTA